MSVTDWYKKVYIYTWYHNEVFTNSSCQEGPRNVSLLGNYDCKENNIGQKWLLLTKWLPITELFNLLGLCMILSHTILFVTEARSWKQFIAKLINNAFVKLGQSEFKNIASMFAPVVPYFGWSPPAGVPCYSGVSAPPSIPPASSRRWSTPPGQAHCPLPAQL